MHSESPLPEIRVDDFVRRFSLRAANLMWLLGAGVLVHQQASPLPPT